MLLNLWQNSTAFHKIKSDQVKHGGGSVMISQKSLKENVWSQSYHTILTSTHLGYGLGYVSGLDLSTRWTKLKKKSVRFYKGFFYVASVIDSMALPHRPTVTFASHLLSVTQRQQEG